jgi:hypothetical protein
MIDYKMTNKMDVLNTCEFIEKSSGLMFCINEKEREFLCSKQSISEFFIPQKIGWYKMNILK